MAYHPVDHRPYSRAERLTDGAVHVAGVAAALMAVPILITLAALRRGDAEAIVATTVYGLCLIGMLGASALYHLGWRHRWRGVYLRLDYSAIYLKIAGTYTPFILLSPGHGWVFLAGLWTAALTGTVLKSWAPDRFRWVSLALYLSMGWAGVMVGGSVLGGLSPAVLTLMAVGGAIYTAGVAFHLCHRMRFHVAIWHGLVLIASGVFFAAVILHLLQTS